MDISFEEFEFQNDPSAGEPLFLVSKEFPEQLKYMFWVGPSSIENMQTFQTAYDKAYENLPAPRRRMRNGISAAQEYDEVEEAAFSDPRHEAFYQAVTTAGDSGDFDIDTENHFKHEQGLEGELKNEESRLRRHEETLRVNNDVDLLTRELEKLGKETLVTVERHQGEIHRHQKSILAVEKRYEEEKKRLEKQLESLKKRPREKEEEDQETRGLFCERCNLPTTKTTTSS